MRIVRDLAIAVAITAAAAALPTAADAAGDAAAGEKVFNKCKACHSLADGKRKVGPSLYGLFSRKAGSFPDFKHSDDMIAAGAKIDPWNEEHFKAYIAEPKKYLGELLGKGSAKTKMAFPGLKGGDIDDVYAYLAPYLKGEKEGK